MFSLGGRTALVTGSVRGLGLEIVRGLAAAGARIAVNGREPARVDAVAAELRAAGHDAVAAPFDVTDHNAATAAVRAIGPVDVLVNNVGHRDRRGHADLAPSDLARLFDVHVTAAYALARTVAASMIERGAAGRIINISSVMGRLGLAGDVAYSAAKAGLEGLTRALAADLGPYGITVNAVAPGTFATEVNAALVDDPDSAAWLRSRTMLGRWGRPPEISGAAVFLASDAASFVTGQTISVDGGLTTHF